MFLEKKSNMDSQIINILHYPPDMWYTEMDLAWEYLGISKMENE